MKTILITAYAVNPYKGSEDGMGWNFISQAARFNKVIAVTRRNNREHIEKYLKENFAPHFDNISFLYYDLPEWARFWKRKSRGALFYYYLWQFFLPRVVKKHSIEFDIAHNLNFHNDWTPSWLWECGKPFVWGPIGHHPRIPRRFMIPFHGVLASIKDEIKWRVKKTLWLADPFLNKTVKSADVILAMNSDVEKVLSLKNKNVVRFPSVGSESLRSDTLHLKRQFTVLSAGRFVALKGFDVALLSFAQFYHKVAEEQRKYVKMVIVGKGPSKELMQHLAAQKKISQAVTFIDWVEREEMKALYNQSSVFLFPSHEGAGMVVAEALSCGLPVVCIDNIGPGELADDSCGIRVPYSDYSRTINELSQALHHLYVNPDDLKKLSSGALRRFSSSFDWNRKGEMLNDIYESIAPKSRVSKRAKELTVKS